MIGFDLDMFKKGFFDRDAVITAVGTAKRGPLSKAGAMIRSVSRNSIKERKGHAEKGKPPHSHGMNLLKRFILFAWDSAEKSVVVGAAKHPWGTGAPEVLEHGGDAKNTAHRKIQVGGSGPIRIDDNGRPVYAKIETQHQADRSQEFQEQLYGPETFMDVHNPFMQPALDKTQDRIADLWKNSVKV